VEQVRFKSGMKERGSDGWCEWIAVGVARPLQLYEILYKQEIRSVEHGYLSH